MTARTFITSDDALIISISSNGDKMRSAGKLLTRAGKNGSKVSDTRIARGFDDNLNLWSV